MTVEEAINKYIEKFGGFPYFQTMGMGDKEIIKKVIEALNSGEEIKAEEGRDY